MKSKIFLSVVPFLILIISIGACKSSKETPVERDFANEGFIKVAVQFDPNQQTPCDYLLKSENQLFDPETLDDKFKKEGLQLWIKYNGQRRPQRCPNAMPVSLEEVYPVRSE